MARRRLAHRELRYGGWIRKRLAACRRQLLDE
jgi:hypothetical protein